jgi:oligopeptide transport system substrate-binding protein
VNALSLQYPYAAVAMRAAMIAALAAAALPAIAADRDKVLRWEFRAAETGFDPGKVTDYYSNTIIEAVFERLLTYDYLARPSKLVPEAAQTMPQIDDGGATFVFKLKKGTYFAPDPAFKGVKRELTAEDVAYSIKRHMDPKNRSYWQWLVDGKIIGLDELAQKARAANTVLDYDVRVPGLEVVDRYTLKIRLTRPDYNFSYILAMPAMSIVAREVIEAYGNDTNAHPVGTGAYMLTRWVRASKITLEANPNYRGFVWAFAPGDSPRDKDIVARMKGRKMPQVGVVEVSVIEEEQSRWLAFQGGELDILLLPGTFAPIALPDNKLSPELARRGVTVDRSVDPEITYTYFNMRDPVIGGFTREKIALRRAIAMAYDVDEEIRVVRKHQAVAVQSLIPAGIVGYDPQYRSSVSFDPAAANALLDKFGYKRSGDGFRSLPDGSPLVVRRWSRAGDTEARELDDLWSKSLRRIGVRMEVITTKFSDLLKAGRQCQPMTAGAAWIADYPDGDNFMQLLSGANIGQSNYACYQSAEFDKLYARARELPDSHERNELYRRMTRQFEADTVWKLGVSRLRTMLVQPGVVGYKKHPILHAEWAYIDVEPRR